MKFESKKKIIQSVPEELKIEIATKVKDEVASNVSEIKALIEDLRKEVKELRTELAIINEGGDI